MYRLNSHLKVDSYTICVPWICLLYRYKSPLVDRLIHLMHALLTSLSAPQFVQPSIPILSTFPSLHFNNPKPPSPDTLSTHPSTPNPHRTDPTSLHPQRTSLTTSPYP